MEVLVGPTFAIEVVRDLPQDKISSSSSSSSSCLFLKDDETAPADPAGEGTGSDRASPEVSSDSSSSIGAPGDSDGEDEEEGVVSSGASLGLASLGSMEDSLPIKRGLSSHYAGKSKSFANLSYISTVRDLQKTENPFNKRRRVLIANKWSRKSSFYSWQNPKSMPLLAALNEDDEDGEDKENPSSSSSSSSSPPPNDKTSVAAQKPKLQQSKLKATFKSQSCFSLTDLQVEHQ